jgi:CHASE2 domain-containing sensor protein
MDVTFGYAILNASSQRDVIRQFVPYVLTANNDTLLSMPAQLAKICQPQRYKTMLSRGGMAESIAFDNIEFPIIPAQDVLSGDANETLLTDRIILIGDIHNIYDSYLSPLHETLPGIVLHAYALQTILSDNYINTSPAWLNWLIALFLCVLFTICNLAAKYHMSNFGNLFIRLLQFVVMYVLIVIGSIYFASHHNYIDFSPAILMIGFGSLSFDLWFGSIAVYNHLKKLIKK